MVPTPENQESFLWSLVRPLEPTLAGWEQGLGSIPAGLDWVQDWVSKPEHSDQDQEHTLAASETLEVLPGPTLALGLGLWDLGHLAPKPVGWGLLLLLEPILDFPQALDSKPVVWEREAAVQDLSLQAMVVLPEAAFESRVAPQERRFEVVAISLRRELSAKFAELM